MKKIDLKTNNDIYNYCYEKAKKNVIRNWNLDTKLIEELNNNEASILKEFYQMFEIDFENKIIELEKFYHSERLEKEKNKYLSTLPKVTAKIEFLITKRLF